MKKRTEEWIRKAEDDRTIARLSTFGVATRDPGMDADSEAAREAMETSEKVRSAVRCTFDLP